MHHVRAKCRVDNWQCIPPLALSELLLPARSLLVSACKLLPAAD